MCSSRQARRSETPLSRRKATASLRSAMVMIVCEQLPEGVDLQVPFGQEALQPGVLLLELPLPPHLWEAHVAVAAPPAIGGVLGDAVLAAEWADGLLTGIGLLEEVDDLWLAESTRAHRIRSLPGADSPIPGGPALRERVTRTIGRTHAMK
jgi:hypothetical protein